MTKPRTTKIILTTICITLGVTGMICCNYGHAALSQDLLVSGEGVVSVRNDFPVDYMQEMTPEICAAADENATGRLVDQRDNKKYWVTKLNDGQCWMTQNLDYDGGGTKFFLNSDLAKWVNDNGLPTKQYVYTNDNQKGHESDGSYYSYTASLAVCPAGWRLPIGGVGGDYDVLFGEWSGSFAQKVARMQGDPYYFRMTGSANTGGIVRKDIEVGLRTMRTLGDSTLYSGYINASDKRFETAAQDWFAWGTPVRCIVGEQPEEPQDLIAIDNMQDVTTEVCANTTIGASRRMYDVRDRHLYWVTRLKDGNCWMTQNLDYDGGGTKYVAGSDLTKWSNAASSRSYYYRGDWQNGYTSYGSLYSNITARSVCPAGWHLPTGGSSGELTVLWSGLGSGATLRTNLLKNPYYYTYAGNIAPDGRGLIGEGTEVVQWTSTPASKGYYSAYFGASNNPIVYADDLAAFGASVRCLVSGE